MQFTVHYPYLTVTIQKEQSIEDFFHSFHLSKKTIHLFKQNKDYTLNKHYVSSQTQLKKGDRLTIKAFEKDDHMYPPVYDELDIIYEDDFLLIVNKPPFIQVFPDDKTKTDSLANRVSGYYQQCGYDLPARYIHRLDYETSGLVLFCKCAFIQPLLDYQLSMKDIQRHYLAIVEGHINTKKIQKINKPIGKDRHHNQKMIISSTGKNACTYYTCKKATKHLSFIKCSLTSGRKHQIRVHMASIGHPLLGDHLYGNPSKLINRQALHAYELILIHPITHKPLQLSCPLPKDIKKIIDSMN